jgi:hypothetical protein
LPRASASRFHERGFSLAADGLLGMPSHSLQLSAGDGTHPPRLMTEGLAEVSGFAFVLALSWIYLPACLVGSANTSLVSFVVICS